MAESLLEAGVSKPTNINGEPVDKKGLIISLLALILSIPALIGA